MNDIPVKLTLLEFRMFWYLIENEDRVVSKQELFVKVQEGRFTGGG